MSTTLGFEGQSFVPSSYIESVWSSRIGLRTSVSTPNLPTCVARFSPLENLVILQEGDFSKTSPARRVCGGWGIPHPGEV